MLPKKICFVDIETTGMRVNYDRIIEIGILRVEDNTLVESYQTLVNPGMYIPEEILAMTGIGPGELEGAPSFYQIKNDLKRLLADAYFVAHNVRFDYSFLKNEFRRFDINFSPKQICSVKLSRSLFPQFKKHNLDALIERFGLNCERRHRAFDDARVLWDFYQLVQEKFPEEKLLEVVNKLLKKPSVPLMLKQQELDCLPQKPGVYIFYGESGAPLYVGKSVNIKDRVLSHFSSDHLSTKEMNISQQIKRIETIETSGELGALLKESDLVKKLQPIYNRQLRLKRKMVVLKKVKTEEGYEKVIFDETGLIDYLETENILGTFRSKKQAKEFLVNLAKKFELCEKLLGLESTKGGCFGYRLGRCKGACLNKELAGFYNLRLIEAFADTHLKPWPYPGPILIKEKDLDKDYTEGFLVDKWCFLGSIRDEDWPTLDEISSDSYIFDLDSYKILVNFLKNPKNRHNIIFLQDFYKVKSSPSFREQDMSFW
jgi:DNA polymerase III subunit epsilon